MKKPTGKPFDSKTGRKASLKSPWRTQPACPTKRAHAIRAKMDEEDRRKK